MGTGRAPALRALGQAHRRTGRRQRPAREWSARRSVTSDHLNGRPPHWETANWLWRPVPPDGEAAAGANVVGAAAVAFGDLGAGPRALALPAEEAPPGEADPPAGAAAGVAADVLRCDEDVPGRADDVEPADGRDEALDGGRAEDDPPPGDAAVRAPPLAAGAGDRAEVGAALALAAAVTFEVGSAVTGCRDIAGHCTHHRRRARGTPIHESSRATTTQSNTDAALKRASRCWLRACSFSVQNG
jgi:hypothetical protein